MNYCINQYQVEKVSHQPSEEKQDMKINSRRLSILKAIQKYIQKSGLIKHVRIQTKDLLNKIQTNMQCRKKIYRAMLPRNTKTKSLSYFSPVLLFLTVSSLSSHSLLRETASRANVLVGNVEVLGHQVRDPAPRLEVGFPLAEVSSPMKVERLV